LIQNFQNILFYFYITLLHYQSTPETFSENRISGGRRPLSGSWANLVVGSSTSVCRSRPLEAAKSVDNLSTSYFGLKEDQASFLQD
jgi:hypothetical protein